MVSLATDKCTKCGLAGDFYEGYSSWCVECHREAARIRYRNSDRSAIIDRNRERSRKYKKAWIDFFITEYGESPSCEICNSQLDWSVKRGRGGVSFDHRHGGDEAITTNPSRWCRGRQCSKRNIEIWRSCDFGILCGSCNTMLPTKDRKEWLAMACKYAGVTS